MTLSRQFRRRAVPFYCVLTFVVVIVWALIGSRGLGALAFGALWFLQALVSFETPNVFGRKTGSLVVGASLCGSYGIGALALLLRTNDSSRFFGIAFAALLLPVSAVLLVRLSRRLALVRSRLNRVREMRTAMGTSL